MRRVVDQQTTPLYQRRKAAGLSRRALSDATGVPFQTIQCAELFGHRPRAATLALLAPVLGSELWAEYRRRPE